MRRFSVVLAMLAVCCCSMGQWPYEPERRLWYLDKDNCSYRVRHDFDVKTGIESESWVKLYGNVYVVKDGDGVKPDLKVKVVGNGVKADYYVGVVKDYASECGLWRYVNDPKKARLKVKFVKSGEDIAVNISNDGESRRESYKDMPVIMYVNGKKWVVAKWVDYKFVVIIPEDRIE